MTGYSILDAFETHFKGPSRSQSIAGSSKRSARLGRENQLRRTRSAGRRTTTGDTEGTGEPRRRSATGQSNVTRKDFLAS